MCGQAEEAGATVALRTDARRIGGRAGRAAALRVLYTVPERGVETLREVRLRETMILRPGMGDLDRAH
jgi:hypothetical protein